MRSLVFQRVVSDHISYCQTTLKCLTVDTQILLTSTAKQVLGNCERMVLANLIGCQPLFCESDCQPLHCTCSLVYWCTVQVRRDNLALLI